MDYIEFLRRTLPPDDFLNYPEALFQSFVDHALKLRRTALWCAALDEEIFCHYVLCPRVNDEDLSFHRVLFYDALWPRVKTLSLTDAVLEVNQWCHENASYQSQDDRTASPLTVYRNASGRCGEESAFLVSALRSVGIPARQVYAPRWSHCDDNHAWVEVLCDGTWRFLGACEPEPVLDRGWFNTAASRAVLIHSRTFGLGTSPLHGSPISFENGVALYNQTGRYAAVKEYTFRVVLHGVPAAGAQITLSVLNEARFCPVARLNTGPDGAAKISLGLGDIWVSASLDGYFSEALRPLEQTDFTLELDLPGPADAWTDFDFRAPQAAPPPAPLSDAQKAGRKSVLDRGNTLRNAKTAAWYPGEDPILKEARGNWEAVSAFLNRDENPLRRKLLESLSPKDLRDITTEQLEGFLSAAAPFTSDFPEEIFVPYVLCPRVACENLRLRASGSIAVVSRLRALGVPARLRPLDGAVEVWENGAFHTQNSEKPCTLLLRKAPGQALVRGLNWSLSRWEADGWQPMRPEEVWDDHTLLLSLPVGKYRLVTAARLPSGDQLAGCRPFSTGTASGETVSISLHLREPALTDLLYCRPLPPLSCLPEPKEPALLFWLEEGAEPTEHILNELSAANLGGLPVYFFLRSQEAVKHPTLADLLEKRPEIQVLFDDWAYDLELLSRLLGCDPDRPPLALVRNGAGSAVYAVSGYHVGSVALLRRIADQIS